ncbi:hypothetical protein PHYPSEUDO_007874 [Phytophthora pseudosyringae]|uniref:F-box domain-containing protein n=1 Tax=Phytophthora pseudosyringae TaxID=221518 RepID=A0A8T1VFZ9_9STRA|nr:hypothetical protein PHYPSEUDO_007874 [Phytophthora pseudosyringae]
MSRAGSSVEATSSSSTLNAPQQLPGELVEVLCRYFTGFDALSLSRTNSWWRKYLSDNSFWRKCFRGFSTCEGRAKSWKKQYVQSRSLLFKALKVGSGSCPADSFAYFTHTADQRRTMHFQLTHMGGKSFSFDLWFSLLPASSGDQYGGVLYGVQSSSRESGEWPHYHQQYVMVNSKGDLYCSVIPNKPVVRSNLEPNRWYHVALTYDQEEQRQDVYFNGVNVQSASATWRYVWHFMTYGQIGTGWSASEFPNCPRQCYSGWYGFRGVIVVFRAWRGVLTQEDITNLAKGRVLMSAKLRASLTQNELGRVPGKAKLVKCTRPTEAARLQLIN